MVVRATAGGGGGGRRAAGAGAGAVPVAQHVPRAEYAGAGRAGERAPRPRRGLPAERLADDGARRR